MDAKDPRIEARDRAIRLLNQITADVAVGAAACVGLFGMVSAGTIPGLSTSTATTSTTSSTTTTTSSTTSGSLQPSSGSVSSSSSPGVAVSGGSS